MIRLALSCDQAQGQDIARRLRGATIEVCFDSSESTASLDRCDAALFLGSTLDEAGLAAHCILRGQHVLIAAGSSSVGDLDALVDMARRKGGELAVVNPDRFLPSRQLIWQQLQAGKLGAPGLVRIHCWQPAGSSSEPKSSAVPTPLVRDLDLAMWLFGKTPNIVFAVEPETAGASVTGRCVHVHLGFPGAGMALIDYTDRLPAGEGYQSLSVIGAAGAAYADDHQNMQLLFRGGRPQAVRTSETSKQLAAIVQDFVDALEAQRDFAAGISAWRNALAVGVMVERSLASHTCVAWEDA